MATAGPNAPGTMADDAAVGTLTWANPDNAKTNNTAYATFNAGYSTAQSHYLKATNFGFAIPSGATIDGVSVSIERRTGYVSGTYGRTTVVKLVKGGTVSGDNKASATDWPDADAVASFGGVSDLWGLTLTDTDINDSTFGVVLSATITNDEEMFLNIGYVDYISITITYTTGAPAGVPKQMMHYAKMRKTR